MKNPNNGFLKQRIESVKFAFQGIWLLLTTESNFKIQFVFAIFVTILGFVFSITSVEWMIQFLVIGLVLVAESLNTAIEKTADFIHPEYHKKIGNIKDTAAAAPAIAALISLIIAGIIYIPKIANFIA